MKQKFMVIDVAQCHDCNNCFLACKDEHCGNDWPGYTASQPRHGHRWMNIERRERGVYTRNDVAYLPLICQQCENAPCIKVAPHAVTRRADGLVMIDPVKAKGNQQLVNVCPFGAIYWNAEANIAQKCTMCAHLLDDKSWAPGVPRCVHSCPTGAMKFYEMEPIEFAAFAMSEGLEGYRAEELMNRPHVFYKNLFRFTRNFIAAGVLVNGDCFEGATVTLKDKAGVVARQKTNVFGEFKFDGLENGEYTIEIEGAGQKTTCTTQIRDDSKNLGFVQLVAAHELVGV